MRDTFYIIYEDSKLKGCDDMVQVMSAYFGQRGIYNEAKNTNHNLFRTTYQNNKFDILPWEYSKIGKALKIVSTEKTNSNSIFAGYIKVIFDFLTNYLNIEYFDIEILDEENKNQIEKTSQPRFISRKSMCLFLERNKYKPISIEFDIVDNGQTVIKRGIILNNLLETDEQAWYSFGKQLDYDDWDITSASFAPMSLDEFKNETEEFAKYWDLNPTNYKINSGQNIISILRISKEWNSNAYLIKSDVQMEFIGTDVWTG